MVQLVSKIQIGDLVFNQVHDCTIVNSVDLLSDTAVIKMPTKFILKEAGTKSDTYIAVKVGDEITIQLAYKGILEVEEFRGYVTKVKPNTPVEIECEDAIWLLRKKTNNKSFVNTTLRKIIQFLLADTAVELAWNIPEVNIDRFIVKNINSAQALQKLKKEFGFVAYIDDQGNLYCGLRAVNNTETKVFYGFQSNIISHDLEYVKAEDKKIKIKMIGIDKSNRRVTVEAGDAGGELRTFFKYGSANPAELSRIAKAHLSRLKYDGLKGTLTSFFSPFVTRGMSVEIEDGKYIERSGTYFVPKVEIQFGVNGGRRVVTLDYKI